MVNKVMQDHWEQVRGMVLSDFAADLVLPVFDNEILYGRISEEIPCLRGLVVSSADPPTQRRFWEAIAMKYGATFVEVDEASAAAGKILQAGNRGG